MRGRLLYVGRHGKTVGTGAHHGEQVAGLGDRDFAVPGQEIAAFANGADDSAVQVGEAFVPPDRLPGRRSKGFAGSGWFMPGVHDDEILLAWIWSEHFGHRKCPRIHDHAAGLQDQGEVKIRHLLPGTALA